MPTEFKHSLINDIGTVPVDVVSIDPGIRATVIGCNLANVTGGDTVVVNVDVVGADSQAVRYANSVIIPANSSLKLITHGEKLVLTPNSSLRITSNLANSIDATVSYVEIT